MSVGCFCYSCREISERNNSRICNLLVSYQWDKILILFTAYIDIQPYPSLQHAHTYLYLNICVCDEFAAFISRKKKDNIRSHKLNIKELCYCADKYKVEQTITVKLKKLANQTGIIHILINDNKQKINLRKLTQVNVILY
jgi:hypothetical protein